ncbi:MAG TPA: FHA domain-containing protein [Anaerolineales bacterium]|nr:FHA domain-containing protein [Anaerolineales bacterium]
MDLFSIHTLLFAFKWVFVGLIYLALIVVVITVRREMGLRLGAGRPLPGSAPGKLIVLDPGGAPGVLAGSAIPLRSENSLGAEQDNDIVLEDSFVSGHHARLRWDGAEWWLEDLGSQNGTFVNQRQCRPYKPEPVPPGAALRLGEMQFELAE